MNSPEHPKSAMKSRPLGETGQCEAYDWISVGSEGEAVYLRCTYAGRVIREQGCGIDRHRCVCALHGLASYLSTN